MGSSTKLAGQNVFQARAREAPVGHVNVQDRYIVQAFSEVKRSCSLHAVEAS